jgi:hypothetical protein
MENMELKLTETLRAVLGSDGNSWTLEEFREYVGKDKLSKSGWRLVGYYTRLDQLCARALDVELTLRPVERLTVKALADRIEEAKAQIMSAVQAIDPMSFAAERAKVRK